MSAPVEIAGEFDQNKVEDVDKEDNRKIIKNFNQINLKNISFSYDKKLVLQNLNLDIKNQFRNLWKIWLRKINISRYYFWFNST